MDNIKRIFSSISKRYDLLNRLLSFGQDISWRKFAAKKMRFHRTKKLLDVACGTCDISILAAKMHDEIKICGVDFAEEMLFEGKKKLGRENLSHRISLLKGDALILPFKDNSFDVSIMAFGMRNIIDRESAIKEMIRVTSPFGQVMILEMSLNGKIPFKPLFKIYLRRLLPFIGGKISKNKEAYLHLSNSILEFPGPETFKSFMEKAGLKSVKYFSLSLGLTYLHVGIKTG